MNKESMIKELQSKLASIGRSIDFSKKELQDEKFLKDALERFEYNYIPKEELQKFYEGAINSPHGYTLEDVESYKKHGIITRSLNTYVAWSSFQDDIHHLGEASANFGVDYKEYMAKRYKEIQKTFVTDEKSLKQLVLPDYCEWDDTFIDEDDGVLVLGEGLEGKIKVNLNELPTMLIAGITGYGKTVMESCIAWQLIKKGCKVIPVDFKHAVELACLSPFTKVITKPGELVDVLELLINEHKTRLAKFQSVETINLTQYNAAVDEDHKLCRIMILIDEIVELNQWKNGLKETIVDQLTYLGRLGRTTGINIVVSTYDYILDIMPSKLRNSLAIRLCGKMFDSAASRMVLESPDAVDIPQNIRGRFKMNAGSIIEDLQAYHFNSDFLKVGDYRSGRILTDGID